MTPAGGVNPAYHVGWHLDPLIQGYFFHIHIWARLTTLTPPPANGYTNIFTDPPDEVYFAEHLTPNRLMNEDPDPDLTNPLEPNRPVYPDPPQVVF